MRRFATGAGFLVGLALIIAGCGGDPETDPPPTPSTPATSPVSTTPSVPALPDAAKENTKAGAIAFVKYYVELINHLQRTGDDGPLRDASSETCKSCNAVMRAAKAIYGAGGHMEGGDWTTEQLSASKPTTGIWAVKVVGRIAPSRVFKAGSSSPQKGSGGDGNAEFFVSFEGTWKVGQWHTG